MFDYQSVRYIFRPNYMSVCLYVCLTDIFIMRAQYSICMLIYYACIVIDWSVDLLCVHNICMCGLSVVLTLSINVDKKSEMSFKGIQKRFKRLSLLASMIPLKLRDMKKSSNDGRYRADSPIYRPTDRFSGQSADQSIGRQTFRGREQPQQLLTSVKNKNISNYIVNRISACITIIYIANVRHTKVSQMLKYVKIC